MTDNEIVKALECCPKAITLGDCEKLGCPALEKEGCHYACCGEDDGVAFGDLLMADALDLINRQKAEIERLQNDLAQTEDAFNKVYEMNGAYARKIDTIKAEAIKEFEDKIKAKFDKYGVDYTAYAIVDDVSKELEGEDK